MTTDPASLFAPEPQPEPQPVPPGAKCGDCAHLVRSLVSAWGACAYVGMRQDWHRACADFAP